MTSEARDLRQVIEVRVTREEMQAVLYDQPFKSDLYGRSHSA